MAEVFVLCNQHGAFLSKQREWLSCGDSKTLFRSTARDELINEKVELTVKSPELRIKIVAAQQEDNGRITIDQVDCLPKASSDEVDAGKQTGLELDAGRLDTDPQNQMVSKAQQQRNDTHVFDQNNS